MGNRYNRYERKQLQQEKLAASLAGTGLYVYKNPSRTGTLTLPKPNANGERIIGPGKEFQGDSYFMSLVNTGDLIKVRTLKSPAQEQAEKEAARLALLPPAPVAEKKVVEKVTENSRVFSVDVDNLSREEAESLMAKLAAKFHGQHSDKVLNESVDDKSKNRPTKKAESMNPKQKKLVLDQPDRVTTEGKVETVVNDEVGVKQLNDHDTKNQKEVLLNEHPVGEIIID